MKSEVALTADADSLLKGHLLQHFQRNETQEDLCFALWRPSIGNRRRTALIDEVILPKKDERILHGNASFQPKYVSRAIGIARQKKAGLAFMHSHPSLGWQGMSETDIEAERDVLAYPAGATGFPLVGLTIGADGFWSARFWERHGRTMRRNWCDKVRIVGPQTYVFNFNENLSPAPRRREILKRTYDTWGNETQKNLARMKVGIIGLGSVGCVVAEAMARIGITRVIVVDPDRIEEHNLDRLLYGTTKDIGELKVDVAAREMSLHATAEKIQITRLPVSVHNGNAYRAVLDCDLIFSCVDRPVARDVLNYIAHAHLIPVVDGGVAIEIDARRDRLFSAHWRAHLNTPYHQCMRCNGQYNSSMVVMELDGSLDDPSYISNLPTEERRGNANVFPFSQSVAAMEVNLMLRYLMAEDWWPTVRQQDYQFVTGEIRNINEECDPNCSFRQRRAKGDLAVPFYLTRSEEKSKTHKNPVWPWLVKVFDRIFRNG